MRRPLLGLALVVGVLGLTAQQASTASNSLPAETTAVYRSTTVTGATLLRMGYTVIGGQITAVVPKLRGTGLLSSVDLSKAVTARFGSDEPVACVETASSLLNALTGLAEVTYDCPLLLLEDADRPRPLVVTAS